MANGHGPIIAYGDRMAPPRRSGGTVGRASAPVGAGAGIPRSLLTLMAAACGFIVADNYYAQPLLPALARDLHTSASTAGLTVTVVQVGYAAGLVLLVPLGDLLARRRLVVTLLALSAAGLAATAAAPGMALLLVTLTMVGLTGSATNVLIPFAATLARPEQRGRAVGTLMTGLLLGILLARTAAGALDEVAGWRTVYALAAAVIAALALALHRALPDLPPATTGSYRQLLSSVRVLVRDEPMLRRRMALGALGFGAFSLLWTALPFRLTDPPYHYGSGTIGLFGLVGAAGVAATQVAGRLQDSGRYRAGAGMFIAVIALAWAVLSPGGHLAALLLGIIALDLGVQGLHVLNQARIYTLGESVRSRVTTAYMTAYFLGGAAGSALGAVLYPYAGWGGVCAGGAVLAVAAIGLWLTDRDGRAASRPGTAVPTRVAELSRHDKE